MQQRTPAPDVAPAIAPPPPGQVIVQIPGAPGASASAIYEGLRAQRTELGNQLANLEDKRRDLSQRLEEPMVGGADRKGLEQRITEIDGRISSIDKAILTLGFGHASLRKIPVDSSFSMRIDALRAAIDDDARAGMTPVAVVATIGTTSTTGVDPVASVILN